MGSHAGSRRPGNVVHGLLVVDKPVGFTSHDVVNVVRRGIGQRRVGHCGSLDPLATGVLVMCLGRATRLARFAAAMPKTYVGSMRLGVVTDTQDRCGRVLERRAVRAARVARLDNVLRGFRGEISQVPPMFSALKRNGVPLYRLARAGRTVSREPRRVTVYELECGPVTRNRVDFRVVCSSGTYIRTICHDIGQALGCGAVMSALRRVAVGRFTVQNAVALDVCRSQQEVLGCVRPAAEAVSELPLATVGPDDTASVAMGRPVAITSLEGAFNGTTWVRIEEEAGRLLAVGELRDAGAESGGPRVWPKIVLEEPVCVS